MKRSKTFYIPYMEDYAYMLVAAFQAYNQPASILSHAGKKSLKLGLDFTIGKECAPCLITTGDIIHLTQQADFDPTQTTILMPTTSGPCRFGQYVDLQRDILKQAGLEEIEIISPSVKNAYQDFGENSVKIRQLIWQGIVATDILLKLVHEYRPYELNPGQVDELYQRGLKRITQAIKVKGGKRLVHVMQWIAEQFETLAVDCSKPRPLIGLVGEIYFRLNNNVNQNIIRQIEAIGGEVMVATTMEWIYFANWVVKNTAWQSNQFLNFINISVVDLYQQHHERKLLKPVAHLLKHPYETPIPQLMDNIRPYYDPALSSEAVLSMGKAIDFGKLGLSGILHVMPFSCMTGTITGTLSSSIRADLENIPWLDLVFEAQGETHLNTRLEAFMYQSTQYHRCTAKRHS